MVSKTRIIIGAFILWLTIWSIRNEVREYNEQKEYWEDAKDLQYYMQEKRKDRLYPDKRNQSRIKRELPPVPPNLQFSNDIQDIIEYELDFH